MGAARRAGNPAGRIAPDGSLGRTAPNGATRRTASTGSPGRNRSSGPPARIESIDALRGLAVLFMLEVHLGFWWARAAPESDPLVIAGTILGGTAAPLFLMLAGAGLAMSKQRRPDGFLRRTSIRGALLLMAGLIFTPVMAPVYGPWGWGVLQCIGLSILLLAPAMKAGPGPLAITGVAMFMLTPVLRWQAGVPDVLWSNDMSDVGTSGDYLNRMMLSGFFPLLPWLGFALLGAAAGEWLFGPRPRLKEPLLLAVFMLIIGCATLVRGTPMEFFPPSLSFTFAVGGACLLALAAASRWHVPGTRVLAPLGRLSLTLFVAHHIIGYLGVRAAGGLSSLELLPDLVAVLCAWVLCAILAWAWSKAGYRYSLEWLLSRAGGPSAERLNKTRGNSGRISSEE